MKRSERLRRTAILCCHCLRNLAFYRAGWSHARLRVRRQFWVNANGNFIDIAVLEWCKLFAEHDGKHHWKRLVADRPTFIAGLCERLGMSAKQFRNYATGIQRYRNKFVAHLDEEHVMQIPRMRVARKATVYLYEYLLRDPEAKTYLADAQHSASEFYSVMYRHAHEEYRRGT